jgi:hypothetical protein
LRSIYQGWRHTVWKCLAVFAIVPGCGGTSAPEELVPAQTRSANAENPDAKQYHALHEAGKTPSEIRKIFYKKAEKAAKAKKPTQK